MPFSDASVNDGIDGATSGAVFAQLHDGDPGNNGTANVATEAAGRAPVFWTAADEKEATGEATFVVTTAGGPFTHVSLWDQPSGGTFRGSEQLTASKSMGTAGQLAVTFTATGTSS